jgi:hypothetical protein
LRLPVELRLKIYRLLLTGHTIHIDAITPRLKNVRRISMHGYELIHSICNRNDAMEPLANLTGTGHSHDPLSGAIHSIEEPCVGSFRLNKRKCRVPVILDVQFLRVCRQFYKEAELLPYEENNFITSHGLRPPFGKLFVAEFSLEKRTTMRTMAVFNNRELDIGLVAELLPGLKRLWFDIGDRRPGTNLAARQPEVVQAYSQTELSSLVGVDVSYSWVRAENKGLKERLEGALLDKQSPVDEGMV